MERLMPKIREIAQRISSTEEKRKKLADFLKNMGPGFELIRKLEPDPLEDLKVVGVDGGIAKKSLHGFDCMLVRAAGACFHYKQGKIEKVDYLPSKLPLPQPEIIEALSDLDWAYFTSISRQRLEVRTALDCIGKFHPDFLLMDGSIVPHYSDKPSRSSAVYDNYRELVSDFKTLYTKAKDSDVCLLGVIEDSRGNSFCRMIREDILAKVKHNLVPELGGILEKTRDTNLLFWVLEKGEKSKTFPYSKKPEEHPILRDFGDLGKDVFSFYLKTAKFDRPIKVDFLRGEDENRIASVLLAISGHHSGYGLPAPLIEADNVAKLSENEINNFYSHILSFAGNAPSLMRLRREQRPF
jgi:hypothetical protein